MSYISCCDFVLFSKYLYKRIHIRVLWQKYISKREYIYLFFYFEREKIRVDTKRKLFAFSRVCKTNSEILKNKIYFQRLNDYNDNEKKNLVNMKLKGSDLNLFSVIIVIYMADIDCSKFFCS